jgi:hypothetical protein
MNITIDHTRLVHWGGRWMEPTGSNDQRAHFKAYVSLTASESINKYTISNIFSFSTVT